MNPKEIIAKLLEFDVCCISDAMDKLGFQCGLYGIKPQIKGKKICGRAFTVHYVPCGVVKGTVGDFLDDVAEDQIIVIDNGGRDYCTVWGDIMTTKSVINNIQGTIIDGVCRDMPVVNELEYPIFSKGYYMGTGKDRVEVDAVNVTVSMSGVQVKPDDYILGDDSGVVVIPKEMVDKVLEVAEDIDKKEAIILDEIKNGSTLREARKKVDYHHLQTKK